MFRLRRQLRGTISATGHKITTTVVDATCTVAGSVTIACSECDYSDAYAIPATGHTYEETARVAASCDVDGSVTYTCSVCGDSYTDTIKATGHSYEETARTAATCTVDGSVTYTCSVCGDSYTDTITATGHKLTTTVVDATCTVAGSVTVACSECDYSDAYAIPATGHTYEETARVAASCDVDGSVTYTCSACGHSYTDTITATGHSYDAVVTDPTCTAKGYTTYTCSVCGHSYTADETDMLDHSYKAVVTAPTCTSKGFVTYTCSVCDDSYTADETDMLDHSYKAVVTAPTCTAEGFTTYTCTVCGHNYTDSRVAALGHEYEETARVAPDCELDGSVTYTCSVCGDSYTDPIPAIGHTDGTFCENCGKHKCDGIHNCPSKKFKDLNTSKWYHEATDFVISNGLMIGKKTDVFEPDSPTTRAEIIMTLYRIAGSPKTYGKTTFVDVKEGKWYYDAILWAEQNGITNGVGMNRFAPKSHVTREQIATMFYRYFQRIGLELTGASDFAGYTDAGRIHKWAREAMSWAVASGFVQGKTATTLVPRADSTRAELAMLLYRAYELFLD